MTRFAILCILCASLAGCSALPWLGGEKTTAAPGGGQDGVQDVLRPKPRPGAGGLAPPANARTVEDFDTTSGAQRIAAADTAGAMTAQTLLGRTVAALGNPAQAGFWLETPLVTAATPGRAISVETGETVLVDLIPISGPEGAGSRISLAALRLLGLSLTGLHELKVYKR